MKRLFILLFVMIGMRLLSFSQVQADTTTTIPVDTAEQARLDSIEYERWRDSLWAVWDHERDSIKKAEVEQAKEMQQATIFLPRYKMYQTDNIYILLKLDTRIGQVWMVQYRMGTTESVVIPINYLPKADEDKGWNGRFELYPTKNMYTFIMVDNKNGDTYQVQWGTDYSHRFIEKITD